MRSTALIAIALLSACKQAEQASVDPKASPAASATAASASETLEVGPTGPSSATAKLAPKPTTTPPLRGQRFQALGTEPFWSLEVLDSKLVYTSPEELTGIAFVAAFATKGKTMRWSGTLQGRTALLEIERSECSDGMSDTEYAYSSRFTWGDRSLQGCATRK